MWCFSVGSTSSGNHVVWPVFRCKFLLMYVVVLPIMGIHSGGSWEFVVFSEWDAGAILLSVSFPPPYCLIWFVLDGLFGIGVGWY